MNRIFFYHTILMRCFWCRLNFLLLLNLYTISFKMIPLQVAANSMQNIIHCEQSNNVERDRDCEWEGKKPKPFALLHLRNILLEYFFLFNWIPKTHFNSIEKFAWIFDLSPLFFSPYFYSPSFNFVSQQFIHIDDKNTHGWKSDLPLYSMRYFRVIRPKSKNKNKLKNYDGTRCAMSIWMDDSLY